MNHGATDGESLVPSRSTIGKSAVELVANELWPTSAKRNVFLYLIINTTLWQQKIFDWSRRLNLLDPKRFKFGAYRVLSSMFTDQSISSAVGYGYTLQQAAICIALWVTLAKMLILPQPMRALIPLVTWSVSYS